MCNRSDASGADSPATCGRRPVLRRLGAAGLVGAVGTAGCVGQSTRVRTTTFVLRTAPDDTPGAPSTVAAGTSTPTATPAGDRDEYRRIGDGLRWETTPVEMVVGSSTIPDGVSTAAAERALVASTETWNGVANAETVFSAPVFDDSLREITRGNRRNEFVWTSIEGEAVGTATIRWETGTNRLVEVNVRLDGDIPWTTTPGATDDPRMDVQSIATHELGHHGLADVTGSGAAEQTMYAYAAPNSTRKRTLEAGDTTGWQVVYGERTPVGTATRPAAR